MDVVAYNAPRPMSAYQKRRIALGIAATATAVAGLAFLIMHIRRAMRRINDLEDMAYAYNDSATTLLERLGLPPVYTPRDTGV